jgi:hypothetical protein
MVTSNPLFPLLLLHLYTPIFQVGMKIIYKMADYKQKIVALPMKLIFLL